MANKSEKKTCELFIQILIDLLQKISKNFLKTFMIKFTASTEQHSIFITEILSTVQLTIK